MKKQLGFSLICQLFLQIISNNESIAQTIITGKVSDKAQKKALSNAIITLNKLNTETTIGFGMSKPSGQYEIKCNANAD
jgi:hypothetical protein